MADAGDEDIDNIMEQEALIFGPWNEQRPFHVGSAFPGVRLRGNGLYESKCGKLASFIIRLAPPLFNIPVSAYIRNCLTGDIINLHLQAMYRFGHRCIYTLQEPGHHQIIIKVGEVELPPIRMESKENDNFVDDVIRSNAILLSSLKKSNDQVNQLSKKYYEFQRKAKETLAKLRDATQLWREAYNSTQIASNAAVQVANTAMEMALNDP